MAQDPDPNPEAHPASSSATGSDLPEMPLARLGEMISEIKAHNRSNFRLSLMARTITDELQESGDLKEVEQITLYALMTERQMRNPNIKAEPPPVSGGEAQRKHPNE